MAALDLIDDVVQKFQGTVVLYDKQAVVVKEIHKHEKPDQFSLIVAPYNARSYKTVNLSDPLLNYKNYQIGYVNGGNYATWWYRYPHKQWSQGLKSNQMGWRISAKGGAAHEHFGFSTPFIKMLEGVYPHIEVVKKALIDHDVMAMAFHKDFALSFDDVHDDFILEYHGTKIGASIDRSLTQFKIRSEARHLLEALQEARNVHP